MNQGLPELGLPLACAKARSSSCSLLHPLSSPPGIIDGMVHQVNKIAKKVELGKQG